VGRGPLAACRRRGSRLVGRAPCLTTDAFSRASRE
jgi:hypothetical protein